MFKKIVVIVISLAISCGLASCDDTDKPADKAETGSVATEKGDKTNGTDITGTETDSKGEAEKNDRIKTEYYPAGNPRKITEYYSNGKIMRIRKYAGQTIDERYDFSYNNEGVLSYVYIYKGQKEIKHPYAIECNEEGLPVKAVLTVGDKNEYYIEYSEGNLAKVKYYSKDGEHFLDWEYTDGLKTKAIFYDDEDGSITSTTEWEYDEYESCTKEVGIDIFGRGYVTEVWEYNDYGDLLSESTYDGKSVDPEKLNTHSEYEYDEVGNVIKNSYFEKGELKSVTIFEYDENRKRIKDTKYDAEGNIDGWTEYEWNEDGRSGTLTCYFSDGSVWYTRPFTDMN